MNLLLNNGGSQGLSAYLNHSSGDSVRHHTFQQEKTLKKMIYN